MSKTLKNRIYRAETITEMDKISYIIDFCRLATDDHNKEFINLLLKLRKQWAIRYEEFGVII